MIQSLYLYVILKFMYIFNNLYVLYNMFFYIGYQTAKRGTGKGKLTERLLAEGLLTPQMLRELQSEWIKSTKKKT